MLHLGSRWVVCRLLRGALVGRRITLVVVVDDILGVLLICSLSIIDVGSWCTSQHRLWSLGHMGDIAAGRGPGWGSDWPQRRGVGGVLGLLLSSDLGAQLLGR